MSRPSQVARHRFWLRTSGGALAATLHASADGRARAGAVLVCPPFGHEYTHSHRSLLHLSDALAGAGIPTLRIDYPGTGDSEGDAYTPNLFERWIDSVVEASYQLSKLTAGVRPALVGLRFGTLMAGLAAARIEVQHFVGWHPVSSGRRYLREYQALERVAAATPLADAGDRAETDRLEAGGFFLLRPTIDALASADATASRLRVAGEALILERDDLGAEGGLAQHLLAQGTPTEVATVPGYLGMMAEPQYTVVPEAAIHRIVTWLDMRIPRETRHMDARVFHGTAWAQRTVWGSGHTRTEETHVAAPYAGGHLVGILTAPARQVEQPASGEAVVILVNSGSVHHVGPNRLYVELARALAAAGTACLRLDLRNLGDSRLGNPADENHPYPTTAVEDVAIAIEEGTRRGFGRFVVAGLCSGAHTAFHAGLELTEHPVAGVICLNPLTFEWRDGMSLDTPDSHRSTRDAQYYAGAVRSWTKWKKLLTGGADVGYIARFTLRRAGDVLRVRVRHGAERAHLRGPGPLGRRLQQYRAARRSLRFVFSTRDPGHAILMSEAGPTVRRLLKQNALGIDFVEGADHTFSREAWRRKASDSVIAAVRSMSGTLVLTSRASASHA